MTELTLEKELVAEGATANHLFSYTSRVSGHRLQEKVEMAFFIPCFSVFTYPLKISYNVFWPSSFSSLSSSQILPLASLIRLLDREWRQEVDGVEKRRGKRTLLCRKVLPRSGLEPKGKLTGIKAENQRLWQCPSVIPFWASKSKAATVNNGSRLRSIVSYFIFLCNLPLFSPSGPSPNLHFTLMSPTPSQYRRTWNKDQVNI